MKLLGFEITRAKAATQSVPVPYGSTGRWITIHDFLPGSWQRDEPPPELSVETALAYHAVFACQTLIAADIGKLRIKLMQYDQKGGIWEETVSPAFSPVLRKPNRYQNHIQFKEWWITSKLMRGNTYALKERDNRGVVRALYILDPCRVQPMVSPDGSVFYDLGEDNLSGLQDARITVPASEIIHDRMNCLFHPLVGVSPIFACGMATAQGLRIQRNQASFFGNSSSPGGLLLAPGDIGDEKAKELKDYWEANYTGDKAGRIAVLGGGLKFEPLRMTAVDSQLIEQLKMTGDIVCSAYHVPGHKVGIGPPPTYNNVEALDQQYYSQCLQTLIESMEVCLDEGLGLDSPKDGVLMGTELDLDGLIRMDSATQMDTLTKGIAGSVYTPNEGRKRKNLKPLPGGDTVYLQQQQYSIEALAERDADKPFSKPATPAPVSPAPAPANDDTAEDADAAAEKAAGAITKALIHKLKRVSNAPA